MTRPQLVSNSAGHLVSFEGVLRLSWVPRLPHCLLQSMVVSGSLASGLLLTDRGQAEPKAQALTSQGPLSLGRLLGSSCYSWWPASFGEEVTEGTPTFTTLPSQPS